MNCSTVAKYGTLEAETMRYSRGFASGSSHTTERYETAAAHEVMTIVAREMREVSARSLLNKLLNNEPPRCLRVTQGGERNVIWAKCPFAAPV